MLDNNRAKVVIDYNSPPTEDVPSILRLWFPNIIKESFPLLFLGFENLSISWYVCLRDIFSTTIRVVKPKNSWFKNKINVFSLN